MLAYTNLKVRKILLNSLTTGNDREFDDYLDRVDIDLIGSRCGYSKDLAVSYKEIDDFADFEEYHPDFYE